MATFFVAVCVPIVGQSTLGYEVIMPVRVLVVGEGIGDTSQCVNTVGWYADGISW